jgi:biopolymer transport protein ExbB
VFELVREGGWVMLPIILCSVAAMAIIVERIWGLRRQRICPRHLVEQIWQWAKNGHLDVARVSALRAGSPLGQVLAAGLLNLQHSREIMKESIEEAGRHVVLELEKYLNTLGTIAAVTPLLGLYGTVLGMIKIFSSISSSGVGNPAVLAGGISQALITTVAGLTVAIPSLMAHRYFQRKVDELVSTMEQEALKMVEILHGEREKSDAEDSVS